MQLAGFEESTFEHAGVPRTVFRRGTGPGVVIMHEIPGITPDVAEFARRVADAGFTVFMPDLFGTPGKELSAAYNVGQLARACIAREFKVLAANESSPLVDWLRALCRRAHEELGGRGVGALGMCITGNFALTLMVDPSVAAPVLSQPSLPFAVGAKRRAGLHVSESDLVAIKRRAENEGVCVLGLRFTHDFMVPKERFERLRAELGEHFEGIEIDSSPGNPHGLSRFSHSVLTKDLVDREGHPTRAALDRVLSFFAEHLR